MTYAKRFLKKFINNKMFLVSFGLALISIGFGSLQLGDVNWDVIMTLFGMMMVIGAFDRSKLLRFLAIKLIQLSSNTRTLIQIIVGFSFAASFFLSNDVTVLTVMPIYLSMLKYLPEFRGRILGAALIPTAANMGGIFFPFSNPQNLIIFDSYTIASKDFVAVTGPVMVFGLIIIAITTLFIEIKPCHTNDKEIIMNQKLIYQGSLAMVVMVACVLGIIDLRLGLVFVFLMTIISSPRIFKLVDYPLLMTFVSFFIIVGNLTRVEIITDLVGHYLANAQASYIGSALISQVISNVPTTILLIPFTSNYKPLLLGANIGGLGTILASLTNLIAYGLYVDSKPSESKAYLKWFSLVNFTMLAILLFIFYIFV